MKVKTPYLLLFLLFSTMSAVPARGQCKDYDAANYWCRLCPYAPPDSIGADTLAVVKDTVSCAVPTDGNASERKRGYLFAVKTNMLYDLATAVNIELEVPIGKKFSIAGEWIFPDWVDRKTNRYCLQTNIKSLEFRMWLGNRNIRRVLTGHYVGVYGQTGDFDFQPFTEKGFRCYDFWAAGVSYGFAHTINKAKTLSLEYGIGIGFGRADYRQYQRTEDGSQLFTYTEWKGDGWYVLPTKLKASIVWTIPFTRKVRNR